MVSRLHLSLALAWRQPRSSIRGSRVFQPRPACSRELGESAHYSFQTETATAGAPLGRRINSSDGLYWACTGPPTYSTPSTPPQLAPHCDVTCLALRSIDRSLEFKTHEVLMEALSVPGFARGQPPGATGSTKGLEAGNFFLVAGGREALQEEKRSPCCPDTDPLSSSLAHIMQDHC